MQLLRLLPKEGYGRVDKRADWILLSRLYLNAQVYTGTAQWDKAKTYAKKVMDSLTSSIQQRKMAGAHISSSSWVTMARTVLP